MPIGRRVDVGPSVHGRWRGLRAAADCRVVRGWQHHFPVDGSAIGELGIARVPRRAGRHRRVRNFARGSPPARHDLEELRRAVVFHGVRQVGAEAEESAGPPRGAQAQAGPGRHADAAVPAAGALAPPRGRRREAADADADAAADARGRLRPRRAAAGAGALGGVRAPRSGRLASCGRGEGRHDLRRGARATTGAAAERQHAADAAATVLQPLTVAASSVRQVDSSWRRARG